MSKKVTEKFTERAKKALNTALREAKILGANVADTEHILLGLLSDPTSVASKILGNYQLDLAKVKESVIASSDPKSDNDDEAFTEPAQEALASAALQAYLQGSSYVGTEHILCGLAKTPSGLACHILRSWGVTYEAVKAKLDTFGYQKEAVAIESPQTPLLNTYSRDLTQLAQEGLLDPVIGREAEIDRVLQILSRRTKNNPILLGEAGVGKTAIAEGLAQKIINREVPQRFFDTRLVSLDLNALVAGTRFRGDFEERLLGVLEEIKGAGNIIFFIDEVQTIVGAGGAGGALDAANILKPALSRGDLRCIGATTVEEYAEFIEADSALERRFQPIIVDEPTESTTVEILEGLKDRYEAFHGVKIKRKALVDAVTLARRYLVDRHLPDSAIDIIDEAASKKAVTLGSLSKNALKIEDNLVEIRTEKEELVKNEVYDEAKKLRIKEKSLLKKLTEIAKKDKGNQNLKVVEEKDVANTVALMTGIPVEEITRDEAARLLNLEKELNKKVVGQRQVIRQIASVLRRSRVGLVDPRRPLGSFIFLGTSGVGKTLVAHTLAEVLFNDPEALVRLDMSEFSERHTVARLVGAPPGYVGFEEGGELTEKLKHRPYSIILLDEIEKAHPEVFNVLLQVLEDGRLTDGKGRVVNFRNTIIIMTSNVGSHLIKKEGKLGFSRVEASKNEDEGHYQDVSSKLLEELKKNFKVEFLNRVDLTLVFRPLTKGDIIQIAKLSLKEVKERLKVNKIKLEVSSEVLSWLSVKGFSTEFGARELRRLIAENIENPLSEKILSGEVEKGKTLQAQVEADKIIFH
ncbi:MAG TPA: ATP-dependent Clp protease ATP-binding subunit [Candidatus Nanoarchaeia archaeon]